MYQIQATIEGIAPVLFNRFTESAKEDLQRGRSSGKRTVEQFLEEAKESKVYRNTDGLFCPALNIKKAMTLATSLANLKRGKKSLGPILRAVMFLEPLEVPFGVKKADYVDEQTGRIPPRTGARVVIYRPALKAGWHLSFTINVFDDMVGENQVREALSAAGIYQGLCDGRPEFGRFIIKDWKVVRPEKEAK